MDQPQPRSDAHRAAVECAAAPWSGTFAARACTPSRAPGAGSVVDRAAGRVAAAAGEGERIVSDFELLGDTESM